VFLTFSKKILPCFNFSKLCNDKKLIQLTLKWTPERRKMFDKNLNRWGLKKRETRSSWKKWLLNIRYSSRLMHWKNVTHCKKMPKFWNSRISGNATHLQFSSRHTLTRPVNVCCSTMDNKVQWAKIYYTAHLNSIISDWPHWGHCRRI